jgi:hypothetical protein
MLKNLDPTDLCFLSSWDYRHEPLVPGYICQFCTNVYVFSYIHLGGHTRKANCHNRCVADGVGFLK